MTTYYANTIRRQARDFIVRLRSVISGSGIPGCEKVVDQLDGDTTEYVCAEVCAMLGLDYEPPPDVPRRKSDGRPSPWARRGGARGKKSQAGG